MNYNFHTDIDSGNVSINLDDHYPDRDYENILKINLI